MMPSPFRPWPGRVSAELPLVALPTAARCARLFASDQLRRWHLDELNDTTGLIASELVSNAVAATGTLEMPTSYAVLHDLDLTIVAMRLLLAPRGLFVKVWDRDPNPPILGNPGDLDESGRGLMLVTALTKRWGAYPACRRADDQQSCGVHLVGGRSAAWGLQAVGVRQGDPAADG